MTPHDAPYFLDNGAFTDHFDADAWVETVERALIEMPRSPEIRAPGRAGAAEATIQRHREWLYDRSMGVGSAVYALLGAPARPAHSRAVRGDRRLSRRLRGRDDAVEASARRGDCPTRRRTRPPDARRPAARTVVWAYRQGFDSADTTTVFQNQYWHYLDRLEEATAETQPIEPERAAEQASIDGWA